MTNISPPDDENLPLIPGTEQPRSLGDMMREAELAHGKDTETADGKQADKESGKRQSDTPATQPPSAKKARKVSRSQARRYARERTLQLLYQADLGSVSGADDLDDFTAAQDMSRVDVEYFEKLVKGINKQRNALDDALLPALDRPIAELDPVERAVLRIAAYELTQCPDIPARVVINEGIEVAKRFGADKGHRYVNGVLDKLAVQLRPTEMKPR